MPELLAELGGIAAGAKVHIRKLPNVAACCCTLPHFPQVSGERLLALSLQELHARWAWAQLALSGSTALWKSHLAQEELSYCRNQTLPRAPHTVDHCSEPLPWTALLFCVSYKVFDALIALVTSKDVMLCLQAAHCAQ